MRADVLVPRTTLDKRSLRSLAGQAVEVAETLENG